MDPRPGLFWLIQHHEAVAADTHHRHGLDWYRLDAHTALALADLFLNTPGTYTHSTVTVPEREALLEAAGLAHRLPPLAVGRARNDTRVIQAAGSIRGTEARDAGGETSRTPRSEVPGSDRWRRRRFTAAARRGFTRTRSAFATISRARSVSSKSSRPRWTPPCSLKRSGRR